MKTLKIFLILLALSSSFAACKKDKAEPTVPIEGNWAGKIGEGDGEPSYDLKFTIKEGNQVEVVILNFPPEMGTWTLNGTAFTANTSGFEFNATFDNKTGKLVNGTYNEGSTVLGKWYLNKQ